MTSKFSDETGRTDVFCSECDTEVVVVNGVMLCPHGQTPANPEEYEIMMHSGDDLESPFDVQFPF